MLAPHTCTPYDVFNIIDMYMYIYMFASTCTCTCMWVLPSLVLIIGSSYTCTCTCSDDEGGSGTAKRAALYTASTVSQIASKKDAEPDRMEIDNTLGKCVNLSLHGNLSVCAQCVHPAWQFCGGFS